MGLLKSIAIGPSHRSGYEEQRQIEKTGLPKPAVKITIL
jgi:hypothetical protein